MSELRTVNVDVKAAPILPRRDRADRPLFLVLSIMVFLACLSAIAANASFRAAGGWNADLTSSATVQIRSQNSGENFQEHISQLARSIEGVKSATPLSRQDAEDLLRPWLGDGVLPSDLPVPHLVSLELSRGPMGAKALAELERRLEQQNIPADIDDHQRWSQDVRRAARGVQIITTLAVILLFAATCAAAGFATQSGMSARKIIINVLEQVGASPNYIARLFVFRFARLGAAAGIVGAAIALLVSGLIWLAVGAGQSALVPSFHLGTLDFIFFLLAPLFCAFICAMAAGLTAKFSIERDRN